MSEPLTLEIAGQTVTADMAEWSRVQRAIWDRMTADRKAREQQQREAGQVWYAVYWRHRHEYKEECFSVEDAVSALVGGEEGGYISAIGVILPDGTMVEDYESLRATAAAGG